jgi:hypothetical protein
MSRAADRAVDAGAVVVAAAGNSYVHKGINSPGNSLKAITVGASEKDDTMNDINQGTYFTSKGPVVWNDRSVMKPDLVAPGVAICAARGAGAWPTATCGDSMHVALSGTSMATPHVAGAAAILLQARPAWTPVEVKSALKSNAVAIATGHYGGIMAQGGGRLDVDAALGVVSSRPPVATLEPIDLVSWPKSIRGFIGADPLASWSLSYSRRYDFGAESASWIQVASGTSAPADGLLHVFTTPIVDNAGYALRLVVEDAHGRRAVDHGLFHNHAAETTGRLEPQSAVAGGTGWSTPERALRSDDSYATAPYSPLAGDKIEVLVSYNGGATFASIGHVTFGALEGEGSRAVSDYRSVPAQSDLVVRLRAPGPFGSVAVQDYAGFGLHPVGQPNWATYVTVSVEGVLDPLAKRFRVDSVAAQAQSLYTARAPMPAAFANATFADLDVDFACNWFCTGASSIALDPATGFPIIAVEYDFERPEDSWYGYGVALVRCGDAACATSTVTRVDGGPACAPGCKPDTAEDTTLMYGMRIGSRPDLAIGPDGLARIAYWSPSDSSLRFVKCGDEACATNNTYTYLDGHASCKPACKEWLNIRHAPDLELRSDGTPVVAFGRSYGRNITIVTCATTDCVGPRTYAQHDLFQECDGKCDGFWYPGTSSGPSLRLTSDGRPTLVYTVWHANWPEARLLQCDDPACSSWPPTQRVSYSGLRTTEATLALDAEDRPLLALVGGSTTGNQFELDFARCRTPTCTANGVLAWEPRVVDGGFHCPSGCNPLANLETQWYDNEGATRLGVLPDGRPVLAYRDGESASAKLLVCGNAACGTGNAYQQVDGAPGCLSGCREGGFVSYSLGFMVAPDGSVYVAYEDEYSRTYRVAHLWP